MSLENEMIGQSHKGSKARLEEVVNSSPLLDLPSLSHVFPEKEKRTATAGSAGMEAVGVPSLKPICPLSPLRSAAQQQI